MLANSFYACGQGLGLAVPALQRSLQHLLCLQSSSNSSGAAYASKAKAEPPYKTDKPKRAPKKKTDAADKPARAVSAYAFYVKEQASARKGEDGMQAKDLMKKIAVEWKALQEHEKAPYNQAAAESKAASAEARAADKTAKQAARGPPSAYNVFCGEVAAEFRNAQQQLKGPDLIRTAAARWKEMPEADKERRKAAADAARAAWKAAQQ